MSSWSFHPKTARFGFASCCTVLVLVILSFAGAGEDFPPSIQYSFLALFCLALGLAAFSVAREQSKIFGVIALLAGVLAFATLGYYFFGFPECCDIDDGRRDVEDAPA